MGQFITSPSSVVTVTMKALVLLCLLHSAFSLFSWSNQKEPGSECNKNQGSCGCCKILRELDRMKTYFDMRLDELTSEYQQTLETLNDMMENRTAFSVSLFSDRTFKCFGPAEIDQPIIYNKVFFNLGDSYNPDTGIFTVPHSGVYSLAFTVYSDSGSEGVPIAACAGLQVNGKLIVGASDQNFHDQEDSSSNVVVLYLKYADEVTMNLPKGCFLCDDINHYNTFSAFLLYVSDYDKLH